jgi:restriction system protein
MKYFPSTDNINPEEFELLVKNWFDAASGECASYESSHREKINGLDGTFEIDVTLRFRLFSGADFLVICECKKHKNPIKRETVQILYSRMQSLGAQKAILVSTSSFQSGAKEFANAHGIALIEVCSGSLAYVQNSISQNMHNIPDDADRYVGLSESVLSLNSINLYVLKSKGTVFIDDYFKMGTIASEIT